MWLFWCVLGFAGAVGAHAVTARLRPQGNRVLQFVAGAGVAAGLLVAGGRAWGGWTRLEWLAGLAAFVFACELYLFLISFVVSSVAVSLLLRGGPVPPTAASDQAPPPAGAMVVLRLRRMAAAGLLTERGARYHVTRRGRLLVRGYRLLRRVFQHETAPEFAADGRGET